MTMIATFPRADFRLALATIAKACPKRTRIPILASVLIRADGERVTLTTCDLDIWATTSAPGATAPDGFAAALDFHRLKDAERKAPASETVTVTISGSIGRCGVRPRSIWPFRRTSLPTSAFRLCGVTRWPKSPCRRTPCGAPLRLQPSPCQPRKPAITSMAFSCTRAGGWRAPVFVSTDGHRLAHHDVSGDFASADWRAIIPRPTVAMLQPILKAKGAAPEGALAIGHTNGRA